MLCQFVVIAGVTQLAGTVAEQVALAAPVLRSPETTQATAYRFSAGDEQLLDEVQRACFLYFWNVVGDPACLVKDRKLAPVSSVAAVGFQLSALPIGVERGWITREQGRQRARIVLEALLRHDNNKRLGIYLHFPDHNTGGPSDVGYETLASTVDTALLISGAIPAAVYFGGEVAALTERLVADANWRAYAVGSNGFLSMGWAPDDPKRMDGSGKMMEWTWRLASDEERLVYFLASGSPIPAHAVNPKLYYRLNRVVKRRATMPPYVVSYPGALFTYFFSHCWIDYRSLEADQPGKFGVRAPQVDWFENSRRAVLTHRLRCIEQRDRFKTFSTDRWGQSACSGRDGYIVPEVQPNLSNKDDWHEGTVAPYAAASAIMFTPRESVAAIRAFRSLTDSKGTPVVWRDPSEGGYGLVDAFNLDQGYASDDYIGIDHGPMLLAIENARTGLIWKLFMKHSAVRRSCERLGLARRAEGSAPERPTTGSDR